MKLKEKIAKSKQKFLDKYNKDRDKSVALKKSRNAASQRNRLYAKNLAEVKRLQVRQAWEKELLQKRRKYEKKVSFKTFIKDVLEICKEMNQKFKHLGYFCETGFRISHGQKSLSVYLKHLWCLGHIEKPPVCPVDRRILKEAGAPPDKQSWGKTNSVCEYASQFNYIKNAAGDEDVCDWEVKKF